VIQETDHHLYRIKLL